MPTFDLSNMDFIQAAALIVVAFVSRSVIEAISESSKRKKLKNDIEMIKELEEISMDDAESSAFRAYKRSVIASLPGYVAQNTKHPSPMAICMTLFAIIAIAQLLLNASTLLIAASFLSLFFAGIVGNASYELGRTEGKHDWSMNELFEKKLAICRPKKPKGEEHQDKQGNL